MEKIAQDNRLEMNEFLGRNDGDSKYKYGAWIRDNFGKWHWEKCQVAKSSTDIHKEGLEQLHVISDKYAYKVCNDRWKELTDGH